jgi:hypothetical protein
VGRSRPFFASIVGCVGRNHGAYPRASR